jgi:hypothetical protein
MVLHVQRQVAQMRHRNDPLRAPRFEPELDTEDFGFASRRLPLPLWPPDVVELIQNKLEGK